MAAYEEGRPTINILKTILLTPFELISVPEWWYLGILLFAMGLGIVAIEAYPTHSNVSPLFFGIALALIFVLPIGVIFSVTNVEVTLNVFAEFVGGLAYPGSALQMNYFSENLNFYTH